MIKNHSFFVVIGLAFFTMNGLRGQPENGHQCLDAIEFSEKIKLTDGAVIIDVRTPGEFSEGHIPHAVNIDWLGSDFDFRLGKLDTSKPVFVYCLSGRRSASAVDRMLKLGFKIIYELDGGILKWREAKLPESTVNQY